MSIRLQGIGMTSRRTRDRMVSRLKDQGIKSNAVLEAMREIPRHIFMEEALASRAYEDVALPIGYNQTISQPYIVAKMTELMLENGVPDKVLEVGTGSGYQTAILSKLVPNVFTVERILPLQRRARKCLQDLELYNVQYKHSDGGWGWAEHAHYGGVLVAAAPVEIPQKLLEQMLIDAIMIIPVGDNQQQTLQRVARTESGSDIEVVDHVSFVPLISGRH